jgi:hypothetical protein
MSRLKQAVTAGVICTLIGLLIRGAAYRLTTDPTAYFDSYLYGGLLAEAAAMFVKFGSAIILISIGIWVFHDPRRLETPSEVSPD